MSNNTAPDEIAVAQATREIENTVRLSTRTPDSHDTVQTKNEDPRFTALGGRHRDRDATVDRERNERSTDDQGASRDDDAQGRRTGSSDEEKEAAKKYIYSKYMDHAAAQDKELVGRWTETLNILLTYAGLQSAIVVSFILAQSPKLEPDPQAKPTYILQQILYHLNNSTALPVDPTINWTVSATIVRYLTWWYLSLACSLIGACGALLCKQWVMHYQSQPAWANSEALRADLREMRYQGIASWQFIPVIESLPVLLELSLVLFTIGLIEYLRTLSTALFITLIILSGLVAIFYNYTFLAGAFVPFCPYQTPASNLWFEMAASLRILAEGGLRFISKRRERSREIVNAWATVRSGQAGPTISRIYGEASRIMHKSAGSAGIFSWWLADNVLPVVEDNAPGMGAIADAIRDHPMTDLVNTFYRMGALVWWMGDAYPRSQASSAEVADILFYFIHQSPLVEHLVSMGHHPPTPGEICATIRRKAAERLPILTMRWSTVAVYLRYQLRDWCSGEVKEDVNHAEIIQELPTLLEDPRLWENDADVANVASLAAVALVGDNVTGVCKREQLIQKGISKYEQLFLALHRLSFYCDPPSNTAEKGGPTQGNSTHSIDVVLALLTKASQPPMRTMVDKPEKRRTLLHPSGEPVKYPSLENGQFVGALLRLLSLGLHYRERAALPSPAELSPDRRGSGSRRGDEIVSNVHSIIDIVRDYLAKIPGAYPRGLLPLSSPEGLARVLAAYASKDRVASLHEGSLALLGQALGLRYYQPQSDSRFSWHRNPSVSLHPRITLPLSLLEDNRGILPQLISDAREAEGSDVKGADRGYESKRRLLLSTIIKGRDLFFMPDLYNNYSSLLQELTSYAQAMLQSGSFLELSPEVQTLLDGFQRWDELVEALTSMDALVKQTAEGEKVTGPLVVEDQGSSEIQALAFTPVSIMPFASSSV